MIWEHFAAPVNGVRLRPQSMSGASPHPDMPSAATAGKTGNHACNFAEQSISRLSVSKRIHQPASAMPQNESTWESFSYSPDFPWKLLNPLKTSPNRLRWGWLIAIIQVTIPDDRLHTNKAEWNQRKDHNMPYGLPHLLAFPRWWEIRGGRHASQPPGDQ